MIVPDWGGAIPVVNGNADSVNVIDTSLYGGTDVLNWNVQTFSDGETLAIYTDGSEGWDFGTNDLNYASAGFGQGFLETATLDDPLEHITDPITGKVIEYENSVVNARTPSRFVKDKDGIRALYTSSVTGDFAGGFMSFDGGVFPDDTPIFFSSWIRATASDINTAESTGSQWKTYRVNQEKYFNTTIHGEDNNPNSIYSKVFAMDNELDKVIDGEVTHKRTNADYTEYLHVHPTFDDRWARHDFEINSGDVDQLNGNITTRIIKPILGTGFTEVSRAPVEPLLDVMSDNRWRWLQLQDYYKHATDVELWRTDLFFQVGTRARFELANGATPETTTDAKILLPKTWSNGAVTLHLYNQMFVDYSNLYIHYYDASGAFKKGVQL